MLNRKYRTVVAAVLAGVVLFSPLLCAMTCRDVRGVRPDVAAEVVAPAEDLAGEFAESAVAGCLLTHVVLNIDLGEWTDVVNVGNWVWVGVEAVPLMGEIAGELSAWTAGL
jgi:hypothetical protein